jgi:hypothetical protein
MVEYSDDETSRTEYGHRKGENNRTRTGLLFMLLNVMSVLSYNNGVLAYKGTVRMKFQKCSRSE